MNTGKQHIDPNKEAANSVATDEYESTLQALINENISRLRMLPSAIMPMKVQIPYIETTMKE